ncbi:MAG: helix-turn-helix transcriptional regulator, partial [Planctomycetes bacterium]|nr:helix-turn-helix transcriptional regulator [Planctomycetota bacterium]
MTAIRLQVTIWLPMNEAAQDQLLSAMAHAARRRMLDLVRVGPGMSVKALASHFPMSRIAVMKHL